MVFSKTVRYIEEKKSRWVLENFSSLQYNNNRYSGTFVVAGCNWRLRASCKDYTNGYLSLYLELADPDSLPSGWRKEVKFCLMLVNRIRKQSNKALEGQRWFDATNYGWGFKEFWLIDKLHAKGPEFLVRDKLIIVVEVQILPAIDVAEDIVKITESQSCKQGIQANDESDEGPHGDDISQEGLDDDDASQKDLDDDDASQKDLDDDDASQEDLDDDDAAQEDMDDHDAAREVLDDHDDNGSSHVSDEGGGETVKITEPLSSKKGNQDTDAFDEGSRDDDASQEDLDNDDASQEDLDDGSSLVSNDEDNEDGTVEENPDDDTSSLYQLKSMVDTTKTIESKRLNKAIVFNTLNNCLKEIQLGKQTVDVYGFQILTSLVKSVRHIFKRHPDTALSFRPKNQQIRRAYVDELLRLIETLCQSPEKLSDDDLSTANETLVDLTDVGFKLDWLKTKLNEVSEKKKIEQSGVATVLTMEEQLEKLKNMVLDVESQLEKEKVKLLAARAPLSFKDVVC